MKKGKKKVIDPGDSVTCLKGHPASGFHNYSYYDCYTVRCDTCRKEYDYAVKSDFERDPAAVFRPGAIV